MANPAEGGARLHPLAAQARRDYPRDGGNLYAYHVGWHTATPRMRVSPTYLERAVGLFDMLFRAAEARGWGVAGQPREEGGGVAITVEGQAVEVRLKEGIRRTKDIPDKAERERLRLYGEVKFGLAATGRLTCVFGEALGPRSACTEGERWRLEQRLDAMLDAIATVARAMRKRAIEREEQHRKWKEEQQREAEAARRRAEEQARVAHLEKQVAAWRQAEEIRSFVTAVRAAAPGVTADDDASTHLAAWLAWAGRHADRIDPTTRPENLVSGAREGTVDT
jgi:hypothetical protein